MNYDPFAAYVGMCHVMFAYEMYDVAYEYDEKEALELDCVEAERVYVVPYAVDVGTACEMYDEYVTGVSMSANGVSDAVYVTEDATEFLVDVFPYAVTTSVIIVISLQIFSRLHSLIIKRKLKS